VRKLKQYLGIKFSECIYNGFWYSPEGDFLRKSIQLSQANVDGVVVLSVFKGNVYVKARWSNKSLYDEDLVRYLFVSAFFHS
jgi:argininosuccinate synthase